MSILSALGYNQTTGMSSLAQVLNNTTSKYGKNGVSVPEFYQNRANQVTQLAETMSSFGGGSGPGEVVLASFPGLGYNRGPMTRLPQYTENTVQHDYLSETKPAMSEAEFSAAITKLAEKNAAAGIVEDVGEDYFELARAYVSVVSPDRQAIVAGASPTALVPKNVNYDMASAYDDDGQLVATYNPATGWTNRFTDAEKARNAQFDSIYWSAYNSYVKANGLDSQADSEALENAVVGDGDEAPTSIDISA